MISLDDLIDSMATILESVRIDKTNPAEERKHIVLKEFPESFDMEENPDSLRSDLDQYTEEIGDETITRGRVNAFIIDEFDFGQTPKPLKDSTGKAIQANIGGKRIITRNFRIFYFYQFGGGGIAQVRRLTEAARLRFNESPFLDLPPAKAAFFETVHDGLQLVLSTEDDFKGTICYVRAFQLTVRINEPQNQIS
jgi:hypothetical protein